jgi:hypothetical protein
VARLNARKNAASGVLAAATAGIVVELLDVASDAAGEAIGVCA